MLKTSSQYITSKLEKDFYQSTVTGDSTFDTKRFTEETSIEEQISFPQMQTFGMRRRREENNKEIGETLHGH